MDALWRVLNHRDLWNRARKLSIFHADLIASAVSALWEEEEDPTFLFSRRNNIGDELVKRLLKAATAVSAAHLLREEAHAQGTAAYRVALINQLVSVQIREFPLSVKG